MPYLDVEDVKMLAGKRLSRKCLFATMRILLCGSYILYDKLNHKYQWHPPKAVRLCEEQFRPPRPVKRKRALTLPLVKKPIIDRKNGGQYCIQAECKLLKLPYELREMIWQEYFGRKRIYVGLTNEELLESWRGFAERVDVLGLIMSC